MIERAALQYRSAVSGDQSPEAWLDGYGFFKTAEARAEAAATTGES